MDNGLQGPPYGDQLIRTRWVDKSSNGVCVCVCSKLVVDTYHCQRHFKRDTEPLPLPAPISTR